MPSMLPGDSTEQAISREVHREAFVFPDGKFEKISVLYWLFFGLVRPAVILIRADATLLFSMDERTSNGGDK